MARNLAEKLAIESKELFDQDEILGEDFHSMLLAIQNLIEYLNRNYIDDENLEKEVNIMTKSLYDPEVEKKGIEKGIERGREAGKAEAVLELLEETGPVPEQLSASILSQTDMKTLTKWLRLAAKAESAEAFREAAGL